MSWNINSIRARIELLYNLIQSHQPDIICLQETKVQDHQFPFEIIKEWGYHVVFSGQKSYNGVAILSKHDISDVVHHLPHSPMSHEARYIQCTTANIIIASVYIPNGQGFDAPQFLLKEKFFHALQNHYMCTKNMAAHPIVLAGDWNIACENADVGDVMAWMNSIICSPVERSWWKCFLQETLLKDLMLPHMVQNINQTRGLKNHLTWWDYRWGHYPKPYEKGLRIDTFLGHSHECIGHSYVDFQQRLTLKTSDHAPIFIEVVDN